MTQIQRTDSLLVIGAHPDDCEFGAGGTTFEWAKQGTEVHFAIVTDGSKGSADRVLENTELVDLRRQEQQSAAAHLGVTRCHFLGFVDGELSASEQLQKALVRLIRTLKPDTVLTHSSESLDHRPFGPSSPSINHRDHRVVGQAVLDAVYPSARNPNEYIHLGLDTHYVKQVGLWGSRFANFKVMCEEGNRKKMEALALHKSQFPDREKLLSLSRHWGDEEKFELVRLDE